MLLATAALVASCFVLGQAVVGLCGWPHPQWWAPAVGYALLLIIFGQAVQHRTHQTALLVLTIVLVAASLVLPFVRGAIRAAAVDGGLLGIVLLLLAAIPFLSAGYAGILGPHVSNDMSQHLSAAWWLRHDTYPLPVAAIGGNLINTGYPLGPHALTAGLSSLGLGDVRGFSAITLAVPVLTGFIALGIVPEARRGARWAFAAAIG